MKCWKRTTVLGLTILLVACILVVFQSAAFACTEGLTPGYWKNHTDAWVGYVPFDNFNTIFGVGPNITLMEALNSRGGGENAFLRHTTAALLNAADLEIDALNIDWLKSQIVLAYGSGNFEMYKNMWEWRNELGVDDD